jgi:hypothetical protein
LSDKQPLKKENMQYDYSQETKARLELGLCVGERKVESQSKNYKVLNIDNARMHWLICQLQYVCVIVKTSSQNYLPPNVETL